MPVPRPFRGFPWWLPPAAAVIAAFAAALAISSGEPLWAAEARVWIRDEQLPVEEFEPLLREPASLEEALSRSFSEMTVEDLAAASQVVREGMLFTVTVAAASGGEAGDLAIALAGVVVDQAWEQSAAPAPAEELGVAWPGPRKIAPNPAGAASLAGLGALLGGIAVGAALTRRRGAPAPSSLALLGRRGWRPLAVLAEGEQREQREPPPSAAQLADELSAALEHGRATAFAPLHEGADAALPALQAARALAGRGLSVLWFDARAAQPALRALPSLPGFSADQPTPALPVDLEDAPLPRWLQGAPPPPWSARMRRLITANSERFDAIVLVAAEPASAALADHVVLAARDDFDIAGAEAEPTLPLPDVPLDAPVLGVALTHAAEHRATDFQNTLEEARENAD